MNDQLNLSEVGGVIAALLVLGTLLKNAFPQFPNRLIPLTTCLLGVPAFMVMSGNAWGDPKAWVNAALLCAPATGIHSGLKNTFNPGSGADGDNIPIRYASPPTRSVLSLILTLLIPLTALMLSGCARFSTRQTDLSYDNQGKPGRAITTHAAAYTFFSASSELAKFKASQTDRTQSAEVGSLNQASTGTNVVDALAGVLQIINAVKSPP